MAYVFLDESGDLGFKKSSSRWFIFTLVITDNKRDLERVVKKVWRSLRKKHKKLGELHASHENKPLQAVDFISWAIFKKYEQSDYKFYDIIRSKIIEEYVLFA